MTENEQDSTTHGVLPDRCVVCNHEMREILTLGKNRVKCPNCGWGWSA